jgi:hypothetical protein
MISTEVSSLATHNTDHVNLTYFYYHLSADPTLPRHVVDKLKRWALKMSVFLCRIEHVMSDLNYWQELMTTWGVGRLTVRDPKAHGKIASYFRSRT